VRLRALDVNFDDGGVVNAAIDGGEVMAGSGKTLFDSSND